MKCPKCEGETKEQAIEKIKVDLCTSCKGQWFGKDEFRKIKDEKEKDLSWMDIDLWESDEKFSISKDKSSCPDCGVPLYEVKYGDSNIKVDVCNLCEGIWLDDGEFKKIMNYLKDKAGDKIMNEYMKTLFEETSEIFLGPEPLKEEIRDVFILLGLLKYRFGAKRPFISRVISNIPKS